MTESARHDAWSTGESYNRYMGRWSRQIAPQFIDWLDAPVGADWLDLGCGTGALSAAIVARCSPKSVLSVDPSEGFLQTAQVALSDERVRYQLGDAQAIPTEAGSVDVIVSALVLNFVPDRKMALGEMRRVGRPSALIGFYVWDYPGGGIEFIRAFWRAAIELDPKALSLMESRRFPFCTPDQLTALVKDAGLDVLDYTPIEASTVFQDFDDYWQPFTLGVGPAPGYCMSLKPDHRESLRQKLVETLPRQEDGSIHLKARAWAVKAHVA